MRLHSSSISSSDRMIQKKRFRVHPLVMIGLWLVLLDVLANILFAYPADLKNLSPSRAQLYFDYGRSMEGRLRRGTRVDPRETAPITLAGWYHPLVADIRSTEKDRPTITIYGMSHSVRLADALQKASTHYNVRSVAAPGASVNWSYGAFLRDDDKASGSAVVLTIMASNLSMIRSMSAMTWNSSFAMPYTADRFYVRDGNLVRVRPPYESFEDYVRTLNDPVKWENAKHQFKKHDPYYDSFIIVSSFLDNSSIVRLIRRGWAQRRDKRMRASALNSTGFEPESEALVLTNRIVADFAHQARQKGKIPVIYVVNNRGYGDQLIQAISGTLERDHIPFVDSNRIASSMDPRNYLPDNHFIDSVDTKMAIELDRVIEIESLGR